MSLLLLGVGSAGGGGGGAPFTGTTLDPADKSANITLTNGDLTAENTVNSVWAGVRSVATFAGGKWHIEVHVDQDSISGLIIGLIRTSSGDHSYPGADASGLGWQIDNSIFYNNGGLHAFGGSGAISAGDTIIVEIDDDAGTLYIAINTGSYFSDTYPAGITAGASQTKKFAVGLFTTSNDVTVNFGDSAWVKTPTSGFVGLSA